MQKHQFLILICTALFFSCGKEKNTAAAISISGTWAFKSIVTTANPYRTGSARAKSFNNDSTTVTFADDGTCSFKAFYYSPLTDSTGNFILPYNSYPGNFTLINDSLITVSTNAYLLNYTYNFSAIPPFPQKDTIKFKQIAAGNLLLEQDYFLGKNSPAETHYLSVSSLKKIN